MKALNFALSVSIFLTLVQVAVGMGPGDVDGALGYGRTFDDTTVEVLVSHYMYWNGIEDGIECCHECKKKYKDDYEVYKDPIDPDQVMAKFTHSGIHGSKYCSCVKPKSPATRPVTTAYGGFSGFCGKQIAQVDGGFGDGRIFDSSVNMLSSISDFMEMDDNNEYGYSERKDKEKCCQVCKTKYPLTEMFDYYRMLKLCKCYTTIPGESPVTAPDVSFADVCGTNVDLAYSTINKANCYDVDIDYPGNDINPVTDTTGTYLYTLKPSAESCQYLCSITDGCNYFTFSTGHDYPYDNERCYLKSSKSAMKSMKIKMKLSQKIKDYFKSSKSAKGKKKGAISGPKNCA